MKKINKLSINIMALNSKGQTVTVSIDRQYDILVRMLLYLFAKKPEGYALHNQAIKNAWTPGFMNIGNESLITEELAKVMDGTPAVSKSSIRFLLGLS